MAGALRSAELFGIIGAAKNTKRGVEESVNETFGALKTTCCSWRRRRRFDVIELVRLTYGKFEVQVVNLLRQTYRENRRKYIKILMEQIKF